MKIKPLYQDADFSLVDERVYLQDSVDESRTIIIKIGNKEFGFELCFGKLIHTWERTEK